MERIEKRANMSIMETNDLIEPWTTEPNYNDFNVPIAPLTSKGVEEILEPKK